MSDPILEYILEDRGKLDLALKVARAAEEAKRNVFRDFWSTVQRSIDAGVSGGWATELDSDFLAGAGGLSLLPPEYRTNASARAGVSGFFSFRIESLKGDPYYGICRSSEKTSHPKEGEIIDNLKMDGFSIEPWWLGYKRYPNIRSRIQIWRDESILDLLDENKMETMERKYLVSQVTTPLLELFKKYLNSVTLLNTDLRMAP